MIAKNSPRGKSPQAASASPIVRSGRVSRSDGDATVRHIIAQAGALFAERGYADTTSKAICEAAGVNMAAVNYHFGSRDGLYLVLLKEVHREVMSLDFVRQIGHSAAPPSNKLYLLIEGLLRATYDAKSWHIRLWARELLAPSPLLSQIMEEDTLPKFEVLREVIMELTGMRVADPQLLRSVLSVIGPVMMLLILDRRIATPIQPLYSHSVEDMARHMHTFTIAGLQAIAQQAGYVADTTDKAGKG
jgi:AcrR family transcriptional regulator